MVGDGQLDAPPRIVEPAANVLGMRFFHALGQQPVVNFEIGDDRGPRTLRNGNRIPHMVTVAVRHQNVIRLDRVHGNRCQRIAGDERVHQKRGISRIDKQTGMT